VKQTKKKPNNDIFNKQREKIIQCSQMKKTIPHMRSFPFPGKIIDSDNKNN
jgi:hypothetical protein